MCCFLSYHGLPLLVLVPVDASRLRVRHLLQNSLVVVRHHLKRAAGVRQKTNSICKKKYIPCRTTVVFALCVVRALCRALVSLYLVLRNPYLGELLIVLRCVLCLHCVVRSFRCIASCQTNRSVGRSDWSAGRSDWSVGRSYRSVWPLL